MNDHEILQLVKHGRSEEIQFYFRDLQEKEYSGDFTAFMDEMVREHRIRRKDIAIRSGLSQDYTYKLLRGDKKTTERDYILAMCIAAGMNIAQVQHALKIYGMPVLNSRDMRSHVIILAIQEGYDIDQLNALLEKSGFHLLRTSPDMPSSAIQVREPFAQETETASGDFADCTETGRSIEAERCGHAPMDYRYRGLIKVRNRKGETFCVEAVYAPEGEYLSVMTEAEEVIEEFSSLLEASGSPFFRWFLEIDRAVDEKVAQVMKQVNDTRSYGARYGAKLTSGGLTYYMEAFNTAEPEKREYFQIVQTGDDRTFTVSHESYYMWMELGPEIYRAYFGEKAAPPEYFISVKDTRQLHSGQIHYRFIFDDLLLGMHQFARDHYGAELPPDEIDAEKIRTLTQLSAHYYQQGQIRENMEALQEAYPLMQKHNEGGKYLCAMVVTCCKLAASAADLGAEEEREKWALEGLSYEGALRSALEDNPSGADMGSAPSAMAELLFQQLQRCRKEGRETIMGILERIIFFLEGHCDDPRSWGMLVNAYMSRAFQIDEEDPEEALEYTGKALEIVRDQGLERMKGFHHMIFLLLNNHAWVLWNRLSSEEAVIYYGRAIDLIEGFLENGTPDPEKMREALIKEAKALHQIYLDTGKEREAKRLEARMKKRGVDLI